MTTQPEVQIVRDAAHALVLLDPERRRLVEALADGPDSAAGLARRLGEKRQRLNYHLRLLEDAGVVSTLAERRAGSRTERVVRLVARRFVLDPGIVGRLGAVEPGATGDRFSATYLVAVAARAVRELAALLDRAGRRRERLGTVSVNAAVCLASPARLNAFADDLTRAVAEVVARHHVEGGEGRWFRVIAGAYPGPHPSTQSEEAGDD